MHLSHVGLCCERGSSPHPLNCVPHVDGETVWRPAVSQPIVFMTTVRGRRKVGEREKERERERERKEQSSYFTVKGLHVYYMVTMS